LEKRQVARFLAIDWDPPKLNVLGANISKGKARIEGSLALPLPQELTAASAAAIGKTLKDSLGQAGLASAPALFCLGRDRVIIKEMKVPYVPAHEEPTIVKFQATKELTDASNDVVLDYARLAVPKAGAQTPVQVVIVRKAIVAAIQALCQAAGLKLHAIVPRPFALAGLLDRKAPTTVPITRGLLVPTGNDEAEFCVYCADQLVWARTLSVDPGLTSEVQKNLMLLATQKDDLPELQRIETTGLPGLGSWRVPKEPLEPWRDSDVPPQNPVAFLGALGLAELAARSAELTVNLASPKEPKPIVDHNQRRKKFAMTVAACLAPLLLGAWYWQVSAMEARIAVLQEEKADFDQKWKATEQVRTDVAALKEWGDTSISWADELYDIAARFPHEEGLRLTKLNAKLQPRGPSKMGPPGHITIHGILKSDQKKLVAKFQDALQQDKSLSNLRVETTKPGEFDLSYDILKRPAEKYMTQLVVPPKQKAPAEEVKAAPTPTPNEEADDE
jgi:hypothetical protein